MHEEVTSLGRYYAGSTLDTHTAYTSLGGPCLTCGNDSCIKTAQMLLTDPVQLLNVLTTAQRLNAAVQYRVAWLCCQAQSS
jgi:hypothetical protein